jgi:hypothetical protein
VKVDIQPDVHDIAARLGAGATYALKALAGRLADDPDMGRPSGLPGILSVRVDGDMFEDCPDLDFGYIREPDRVEIRFLMAGPPKRPPATGRRRTRTRTTSRRGLPTLPPTRSPYGRSPMPGSASPAGSGATPPTPMPRSAPARAPPPSPPWRPTSASRYPSGYACCGS